MFPAKRTETFEVRCPMNRENPRNRSGLSKDARPGGIGKDTRPAGIGKGTSLLVPITLAKLTVALAAGVSAFLLQSLYYLIQIRIPRSKASCEPVATAFNNLLTVGNYVKLPGLSRCNHRLNTKPLLDEGRETRDLGFIVSSSRAGHDFHSHLCSNSFAFHICHGSPAYCPGSNSFLYCCHFCRTSVMIV